MRKRIQHQGFTLIELLIVVAIIAILAAIAVPNYLEAQVRAKVARTKADMRNIATAIEVMMTDRGVMLIDFWDDRFPEAWRRCNEVFRIPCPNDVRGGTMNVLTPLTTPTAYITNIPIDIFISQDPLDAKAIYGELMWGDTIPPRTFIYVDQDPGIPGQPPDGSNSAWTRGNAKYLFLKNGQYLLIGAGPNRAYERDPLDIYDPSNGTVSGGDVIWNSHTTFSSDKTQTGQPR